jgi:Cu+-exporting ATPase
MINMSIDPVCGMIVDEKSAPAETRFKGYEYYFCTTYCKEAFKKEPKKYMLEVKKWGEAVDPVCGMSLEIPHASAMRVYNGQFIYFCNPACKEKFDASPEKYLKT